MQVLWLSGLSNYIVGKICAAETHLRPLKFVIISRTTQLKPIIDVWHGPKNTHVGVEHDLQVRIDLGEN